MAKGERHKKTYRELSDKHRKTLKALKFHQKRLRETFKHSSRPSSKNISKKSRKRSRRDSRSPEPQRKASRTPSRSFAGYSQKRPYRSGDGRPRGPKRVGVPIHIPTVNPLIPRGSKKVSGPVLSAPLLPTPCQAPLSKPSHSSPSPPHSSPPSPKVPVKKVVKSYSDVAEKSTGFYSGLTCSHCMKSPCVCLDAFDHWTSYNR